MAQNYNELAAYVGAHKSDPLTLAKVMNNWVWASLLPSGAGQTPMSARDVPLVMNASCGWRDTLMEALFEGAGIQHRRVNFYDVPFQGNHTATELFINGKWMFFDSTFGLFFTKKGSSVPLSMEEARSLWPNVEIQKSTLGGWQGGFLNLGQISAKAYKPITDTFAYAPSNYVKTDTVVSGELYSLYFVKRATYLDDNGIESLIPGSSRSWSILTDSGNAKAWRKYTNFFDAKGRLDAKYILMDDKSHVYTHWDRDNNYDWLTKVTKITAGSRAEQIIVNYDDRSKDVRDIDAKSAQTWSEVFTHYGSNKALDYSTSKFDDGSSLEVQYDAYSAFSWSNYVDSYDTSGQLTSTTITFDDGSVKAFNWATAAKISGDTGNNSLVGTAATDALFGGDGDDVLDGGNGWDRLDGGMGNDIYIVDTLNDIVIERSGGGHDTVVASDNWILGRNVEDLVLSGSAVYGTGQELNNWIVGNTVDNVLTGAGGNDRLRGLEGDDLLIGGPGKDTLEGGRGSDTLYGSKDADTFLWRSLDEIGASKANADVVKDFSRSQGDSLNFRLIDADETRAGNQAFTFVGDGGFNAPGQIRYVISGGETTLYFNTDADPAAEAVLRLTGHHKPDASWFVL